MTDIELKLNAWTSNPGTTVFCVQGEQQARTLHVTLIDRTGIQDVMSVAPVTPRYIDLTGYTPRMYVSKPDETGVYFPGTVTDAENGRVDFTLTGQCVAVPGKADCTISLIKEDVELKIVGIVLDIKKSDTDDFIEGSRDEFVELEVLTSQAKEATAECIAATERAEQAVEAANEVVQADHAIVEDAKTQAASAKEAAALANVATQSANSATSSAQSAAARANAAADRLEGTDVGTLANELDAHTGSQVNTSNGVHGMRINDGQLYIGSLGRWDKAIDRTYANPRILPDSSDLSRVSEPGVYAGKNPAGALSGNTQYILVVSKAGNGLISRSVTFPFEDAIYSYSASKSSWLPVNTVKNDTYVENGITVNIAKVNKTCQIFINTDQSKISSCSAWNEVTILTLPQEYRPKIDAMYGMIGESGEQYADLANHQYWIVMYPDGRINLACRDKGFNTAPSNYGWRFSATYITAE